MWQGDVPTTAIVYMKMMTKGQIIMLVGEHLNEKEQYGKVSKLLKELEKIQR